MWVLLKFRLLSSLSILHSCQYALHQLHDMEGKKERKEWKSYSGENLIYTYRGILFINHYAYDEHDLVNIYKDWPVVV